MSIDMIKFLELDNYINENYDNLTVTEYEALYKQLEEIKEKILNN
jgi:hypothetical protein